MLHFKEVLQINTSVLEGPVVHLSVRTCNTFIYSQPITVAAQSKARTLGIVGSNSNQCTDECPCFLYVCVVLYSYMPGGAPIPQPNSPNNFLKYSRFQINSEWEHTRYLIRKRNDEINKRIINGIS
jgi:hypothetical protein